MFENLGKTSQLIVGFATLAVVLLSAIALGANRPVSWTLLSLAVITLFLLQVVIDLIRPVSLPASRLWLPTVLYLLVIIWGILQITPGLFPELIHPSWARVDIAGAISADPGQGRHAILRLSMYAMVFWIAVRFNETREMARISLIVISVFTTAIAAYGIYAYFSGNNPILTNVGHHNTLTATFPSRNNYATFAMFGLMTSIVLYIRLLERNAAEGGGKKRLRDTLEGFFGGGWIYGLGIILGLGAIALSQSRAGAAASLIAIAAFVVFYFGKRKSAVGPLALGSIVVLLVFILNTVSGNLINRILYTDGEEGRFYAFPKVVQGIFDRPMVGHGLGSFRDTFRAYVPPEIAKGEWDMAHNSWLENMWDLGIPMAMVLNLALLIIFVRLLRGALRRRSDRHFAALAVAICIGGAFHAMFDFSFQIPAISALFAYMIGLGYAQSFRGDELKRRRRSED